MLGLPGMRGELVDLRRARHGPDWQAWHALATGAPPFLAPEFFALVAPFHADRAALVGEAWDGDRLVGALPLARDGDRLHALRCDYSPVYDYRGSPGGLRAIWDALRADPRWSVLSLSRVPAGSPLATELLALAAEAGCPSLVRRDQAHLYLELPGFQARLSSRFRHVLAKSERHARGVDLERIAVPDRDAFDEALALEARAWKHAAGTSLADDPRGAHLFRALGQVLGRRGQMALYFLRSQGRRIAMLFAVEDAHTLYALKMGYDPSVAKLGPGHLLIWKLAADAEARGLQVLDFLGRDDAWKHKWTDRSRDHVRVVIYRDSVRGVARFAASSLIRPHLPGFMRDSLRSPLPRGCQCQDVLGAHSPLQRLRITPRPIARRVIDEPGTQRARVRDLDEILGRLDLRGRRDGLTFMPEMRAHACKRFPIVGRVDAVFEHGRWVAPRAPIVVLDGLRCAGECGCPLLWHADWLVTS